MRRSTDVLTPKRILCATDFSATAAEAFEAAVVFAHAFKAEILVVHVCPSPEPSDGQILCLPHRPGDENSQTGLSECLDRCCQRAAAAGILTRSVLLHGTPPEEIVRETEHSAADLIVMGCHSRGALHPWSLASVTECVVRRAPCPVVVVRSFPHRPVESPRGILCALDLGETGAATLEYAVAMTNALEANLLMLHVVAGGSVQGARSAVAAIVANASSVTKGRIQERVVDGVPYQEILAAARDDGTDLVVIGSHGGGIADRQFLGSTTVHLLRHFPSSVLVVPAQVGRTREQCESEEPEAVESQARRPLLSTRE